MPDPRTHKSVAERLDIELRRRPNRLLIWRRWLTLICGLLPLVLVGVFAVRGDRTIFWSRPVASGHTLFQNDCRECHQTPWQPLVRAATFDNRVRSVHDENCRQCHEQRSDDHARFAVAAAVPACAACHQEHRGRGRLADVADAHCITCHQRLETGHSERPDFVTRIGSFDDHPEFAVRRSWESDPRQAEDFPGPAHRIHEIAELEHVAADSGTAWQWRDAAAIRFNHDKHLAPLLVPWDEESSPSDIPKRVQLSCHDCHQLSADGRYMQPVIYEQHCQQCHPLRFSGVAGARDALPHASLEIVRGVLRDRLTTYARQHPDELPGEGAIGPSRLPHKPDVRRPAAKDEWDWVEGRMELFATMMLHADTQSGCQHCHVTRERPAGNDSLWSRVEIVPPSIPDRWMPHSRFRHDRHRTLECGHCHSMLESTSARDISMPSIAVCHECHGRGTSQIAPRVSANCVDCHTYHHTKP